MKSTCFATLQHEFEDEKIGWAARLKEGEALAKKVVFSLLVTLYSTFGSFFIPANSNSA